jgi:hypothetical protein
MMVAGVNRCYFHGTAYSPQTAPWPGYLFYAAMEMNPQNTIWRDVPAFTAYMQRVQQALQEGQPDNDLLLYLPVYDIWSEYEGRLLLFDIHKMDKVAPRFIHAVNAIYDAGYDLDYVSDRMIDSIRGVDTEGRLIAPSGITYSALVLPQVKRMPESTRARIAELEAQGATVIWVNDGNYQSAITHYQSSSLRPETMKTLGLKTIRRRMENGYRYFITNLQSKDIHAYIHPAVTTDSVLLSLHSGESCLMDVNADGCHIERLSLAGPVGELVRKIDLTDRKWTLTPVELRTFGHVEPVLIKGLQYWSELWKEAVGTVAYETTIKLSAKQLNEHRVILNLGDVRESAHVYVNDIDAGIVFCAPFEIDITPYLRKGKNTLRIEVTSLAANYIAEMDRRGIVWRNFKDANIANLKGGKVSYYGNWDVMPCGLNAVELVLKSPSK